MQNVDHVTYKIPGDARISAVVGKQLYLTPFKPTGEIVQEIQIHDSDCALIITDVQQYRISWWRIIEWAKQTTTGA